MMTVPEHRLSPGYKAQ